MTCSGWIYLHRSILDWEWYDDLPTWKLFLHLVLRANYKPTKWRGITIERGQLLTSRSRLSEETRLTDQEIRTALNKLKSTSEITIQSTNRNTVITVCKYDTYQIADSSINQQNNQQSTELATNNQPASNQPSRKERKESNKEKELNSTCTASADAEIARFLISRRKRKLTGKRLETFEEFWDSFDYKRGKAEAIDAWLDIPELNMKLVADICRAAKIESSQRQSLIASGCTPKMAQGWLSGRRWEDDTYKPKHAQEREIEGPNGWRIAGFEIWPQKGADYWQLKATWSEIVKLGCHREIIEQLKTDTK